MQKPHFVKREVGFLIDDTGGMATLYEMRERKEN
jgi:hypothetical protein